jgi:hypothetical protein
LSTGVGILWTLIRYFCHTDPDGQRADFCARYAEAFLAIGERVRIIPVEFAQQGERWKGLSPQFTTPLSGDYVNVVCAHPFWWTRLFTVGVRNVLITQDSPESALLQSRMVPASAKIAAGVKVDIIDGEAVDYEVFALPNEQPDPRIVAIHYQAIVAPTPEIGTAWRAVVDDAITQVDNGEASDHDTCQVVVVGVDLAERANALRKVLALG